MPDEVKNEPKQPKEPKTTEEKVDDIVDGKKIEKIVTGEVEMKQKGLLKKAKGIFFGGEFKSASRYVFSDVLLPAARDMMFDTISKGVERVVYGETSQSRRARENTQFRGNVAYNRPVNRGRSAMLPDQAPRMHRVERRESNDVLLETMQEATLVLQTMCDLVAKYEVVSMADLNEMLGHNSANVDHKWGWTDLGAATVRQTRQGALLELPPVEEI